MTVVSAAADETLRFWEIMGTPLNEKKKHLMGASPGCLLPALNSKTPRSGLSFAGIR
jgi:WD40 repeat protein